MGAGTRRPVAAAGALSLLFGLALLGTAAPASAAIDPKGLSYVALGDSYSAGFGILPFEQNSPVVGTSNYSINLPPQVDITMNGCYQATANYPHVAASILELALNDQTCSGAVTGNITTTPQLTMSQQQLPAVQGAALSAETRIVTLTIGGNDLLFSTIAENCLAFAKNTTPYFLANAKNSSNQVPATCEAYYTAAAGTYTDTTVTPNVSNINVPDLLTSTVVPALQATYSYIKAQAPNAQVFVIGYPQIAPPSTSGYTNDCYKFDIWDVTEDVPFNPSDIVWMHGVQASLVSQISTLVGNMGSNFHYVDAWTASAGRTICDSPTWIDQISGTEHIVSGPCDPRSQQPMGGTPPNMASSHFCMDLGALHPNAAGVTALIDQVSTAIATGMPPGLHLASGSLAPGSQATIQGFGLPAGASVDLTFESTPVPLGTASATTLGTFLATVTIPADAAPGLHHIVATSGATTYSLAVTVSLPATGAESLPLLATGGALAVLGLAALLLTAVARRRDA